MIHIFFYHLGRPCHENNKRKITKEKKIKLWAGKCTYQNLALNEKMCGNMRENHTQVYYEVQCAR